MTDPFRAQIQQALANPALQAALDANAERRVTVRKQALASLQDPEGLRKQAHAVRAEVIDHLDHYLETFIAQAQANGLIIHRAPDAATARKIVLEIATSHNARLIAKSKSMLSEEIELNHALEQAGLKVVETDLGEYIVQLRGERPAHIITPAVHLRRQEVGQTFHEKLGIPLTDDIPTMTGVARRMLRQVFLEAEIGISGVNFGVAETGSLCLLTNEGNGRMVTTLPKVHIALMGIERLVPTLEDLALMLQLQPRSATGQKLTVYTSLIHSPRREGEVDGAHERHVILVDNGRTQIRNSPLQEILYCIRCGACLNACPVFRELGGHAYVSQHGQAATYPGPLGSVLSPGLFGADFANLARASSLCGACKDACPVEIDLPKLLLRIRSGDWVGEKGPSLSPNKPAKQANSRAPAINPALSTAPGPNAPSYLRWGIQVFTWMATHPALFSAAQKMARLGSRLLSLRQPWLKLPPLTGWGYSKDFPRPASQPFHVRWKNHQPAVASPVIPETTSPPAKPVLISTSHTESLVTLKERFAQELVTLGGLVVFCQADELGGLIQADLKGRGSDRLLAWEAGEGDNELPNNLITSLQAAGIRTNHQPDPNIPAGLTGAIAAIADTGTIILPSGTGKPLTASLLPEMHLVVLPESRIYACLADVFSDPSIREQIQKASTLALISGPSRTADIEMTLTIGVHGPGEICVYCFSD